LETSKIGLFNTNSSFGLYFQKIYPLLGINRPKKAFRIAWEGFFAPKERPFLEGKLVGGD
jgi:hypothetical protein